MSAPVAIEGEAVARLALSAAAQSPTTATLAALEAIPPGAWDCADGLADYAKMLCAGIRAGEAATYAAILLDEFGNKADPWLLNEYAQNLTTLFRALKPTVADTPVSPTAAVPAKKTATLVIDNGDGSLTTRSVPVPDEPAPAPRALPAFTDLSNVWDMADEEVPHLFGNSMPMGELSVIASEPGAGKTTLVIGLALSVAIGRGLVAGYTPRRRGKVALLLAEDGPIPTAQRLRGWCKAEGVSRGELESAIDEERIKILCGDSSQLLDFSTGICRRTKAYEELVAQCHAEHWDLLVVDSLIEWTAPPSENDNAVVQQAAKSLIDLARVTGGAVLALHHTNKASDKTGATGLHAIRGGSSLAGKIRWGSMLSHLHDDEVKRFEIPKEERWRYLRLDIVKSQYSARAGEHVYLERGEGGIPHVVNLRTPSKADEATILARALADKIGGNPGNLAKWNILTDKPGADIRKELKADHGKIATQRGLTAAYAVAIEKGWLVEDASTHDDGDNAKIPRIPAAEVVECED